MKNPKHEIILQNTKDGMMAHWLLNGNPDPEIVGLFGTHIIPTAYSRTSRIEQVVNDIKRLNPGYMVSVV